MSFAPQPQDLTYEDVLMLLETVVDQFFVGLQKTRVDILSNWAKLRTVQYQSPPDANDLQPLFDSFERFLLHRYTNAVFNSNLA